MVALQILDGFCLHKTEIMPDFTAPQFEADCFHNEKIEKFSLQDLTFNESGESVCNLFLPCGFWLHWSQRQSWGLYEWLRWVELCTCSSLSIKSLCQGGLDQYPIWQSLVEDFNLPLRSFYFLDWLIMRTREKMLSRTTIAGSSVR